MLNCFKGFKISDFAMRNKLLTGTQWSLQPLFTHGARFFNYKSVFSGL